MSGRTIDELLEQLRQAQQRHGGNTKVLVRTFCYGKTAEYCDVEFIGPLVPDLNGDVQLSVTPGRIRRRFENRKEVKV